MAAPMSRPVSSQNGVEYGARLGPARDERRHPPQRGLFVREQLQFLMRVGVGDCGRDQVGEAREPGLGIGRLRLGLVRSGDQGAPHLAVHHDRCAYLGSDAKLTQPGCSRPDRPS